MELKRSGGLRATYSTGKKPDVNFSSIFDRPTQNRSIFAARKSGSSNHNAIGKARKGTQGEKSQVW